MNTQVSAIRLFLAEQQVRIEYRRADLGELLFQRPAHDALALIPRLLPVCGKAQHIAATRALEAACGEDESDALMAEREAGLLQEQALAAAWRLLVDWPRALGEKPDLASLKRLRSSDRAALANGLENLLPRAMRDDGHGIDEFLSNHSLIAAARCPDTVAGRALQESLQGGSKAGTPVLALRGERLWERAREFLGSPLLTPSALAMAADTDPISVGPLAMGRHRAADALAAAAHIPPVARMLLAALLDTKFIIAALLTGCTPETASTEPAQRSPASGVGVGGAMTVRGPLYHMVAINDQQQVQHWRYLAPTDWHFSPGGLVDRLAAHAPIERDLKLLLMAADPCAPWEISPMSTREVA